MDLMFEEKHFKELALKVNYNEVTDFKQMATFDILDTRYALYDQYCKNINCDCTGATVEMVKMIDNGLDTSVILTFDYDYKKKIILEAYSPIPEGFEEALLKVPNFIELIENRSLFVKKSFEIAKIKREMAKISKLTGQSNAKIPRNAPCPCESGRKYKNCCGK